MASTSWQGRIAVSPALSAVVRLLPVTSIASRHVQRGATSSSQKHLLWSDTRLGQYVQGLVAKLTFNLMRGLATQDLCTSAGVPKLAAGRNLSIAVLSCSFFFAVQGASSALSTALFPERFGRRLDARAKSDWSFHL